MTEKRPLPVLAVDLGGTKIAAALVSEDNKIIAREHVLTLAAEGQEAVIGRLFSAIDALLKQKGLSRIHSICLAVAGPIDVNRSVVSASPNLPGWRNVAIREIVARRYQVSTFLLNDAKAAALGEHRLGAGRGISNLVYVTVGTGIGGGIIINGKLYSGTSGCAGEIGHMTIDVSGPVCSCGNIGCWEVLASGTALAREAIRLLKSGKKSSLTEMVGGKLDAVTAEKIALAAQSGDSLALKVISRTAAYLGVGLINLVNIFNPEMIVIGGGLSKVGDLLLEPAKRVMKERAFSLCAERVRIVTAQLGDDVGVLGAALFAREQEVV